MQITFVLPKVSRYPVGGYKMVFEYANRFIEKRHNVNILYLNEEFLIKYHLPLMIRKIIALYYVKKELTWFSLNNKIKKYSSLQKSEIQKLVCKSDVVVATAVQTVNFVNQMFECKKVYYIQGLENWKVSKTELYDTYSLNMPKISIAEWLKEIIDNYSPIPCKVIKNPVDIRIYREKIKFDNRPSYSISLLYNELPTKGFKYALEAIMELKKQFPRLIVNMFGRNDYPNKLPDWIIYTKNANQEKTVDIYNSSKVFLCASIEEGYGLTGLEAMACGCVLVSTKYKGVLEYANDENALLVPVKDVTKLVEAVSNVFKSNELCNSIRRNAKDAVLKLSWDSASKEFEDILLNA